MYALNASLTASNSTISAFSVFLGDHTFSSVWERDGLLRVLRNIPYLIGGKVLLSVSLGDICKYTQYLYLLISPYRVSDNPDSTQVGGGRHDRRTPPR